MVEAAQPINQIVFDEHPTFTGFGRWDFAGTRPLQHRLRV
jgi:hypothetical protein